MVDVLAGKKAYYRGGSTTGRYLRTIATESAGDPRVGMIGGSYGGQIQYAVAKQDPRIDAIIPIITWNDLNYSLAPGRVAKKQWIDLFFGAGIVSGVGNANEDPETMTGCPNFTDQACVGAANLNTTGYADPDTEALARHASVASYVKQVKAPTLLVQGQKDTLFNLNEAVATYASLKAQGTPVKMVWQSWGHSDSDPVPGELDFGASSLRGSYLGNRFLNWMNHYVRGQSTAHDRPAVRVLPRLGALRHRPVEGRQGDRRGVQAEQHGLLDADQHPLLHRQRRPDRDQGLRGRPARRRTPTPRPRPRRTPRPPGSRATPSTTSRATLPAPSPRSPHPRSRRPLRSSAARS